MSDQKFREEGQATVEFALLLPIVALMLMAIFSTAVLARDSILLTSATREAARSLSVENDTALALEKANKVLSGVAIDIDRPSEKGSTLRVDGSKEVEINILFIPSFKVNMNETIHMRVENE